MLILLLFGCPYGFCLANSPPEVVFICRKSVRKSGRCKVMLFASVVPMQLVQGWESKACYWGINNKALSSSNTHARIDCYLCFAFSFLWLLLHSSGECATKWIGLSSHWYAANVLKYLCSNRFFTLVCLASAEVGEGIFPVVCAEGQCTSSNLFSSRAATRASFKATEIQSISFSQVPAAGGERRPGKTSRGRRMGERRRLKYRSLKLMILEFMLLRFKILNLQPSSTYDSFREWCKGEERGWAANSLGMGMGEGA